MRKTIEFLAVVAIVWCLFGVAILLFQGSGTVGSKPSISAPQDVLEVSVKDKEDVLLEDVTAEDSEDGNLNASVFVESISPFDEEQCRTVTYAVFDSDDNLSQTTRRIKYKDYEAPELVLKQNLSSEVATDTSSIANYFGAKSSVDGDISGKVLLTNINYDDYSYSFTVSVTDSCGVTSQLNFETKQLVNNPTLEINLSNYLIYVKKGKSIDPNDYLESVMQGNVENKEALDKVSVIDNYNADKPGMYEFVYEVQGSGNNYGTSTLYVVVEE